jgi:hypothetical protein
MWYFARVERSEIPIYRGSLKSEYGGKSGENGENQIFEFSWPLEIDILNCKPIDGKELAENETFLTDDL